MKQQMTKTARLEATIEDADNSSGEDRFNPYRLRFEAVGVAVLVPHLLRHASSPPFASSFKYRTVERSYPIAQ
ncbi:hypothetical protein K1719_046857 [Acacia pycnantha]|nr:hypothetical protein K1719_046857 [Acacia pycnantha]